MKEIQTNLVSQKLCNARAKTEMDLTLESICAEEQQKSLRQIIKYYCVSERDAFIQVAQEQGLDYGNKIMKPEFAAAMLSEAGIGLTKSRVMNRYLTAFLGR